MDEMSLLTEILFYILSGLVFGLTSLLAYIWRTHVTDIAELKKRFELLDDEVVRRGEFDKHVEKTEALLEQIRNDLWVHFKHLNALIHKVIDK